MKLIDLDEIEYFTLVDKDGIPRYRIEIGDGLPIVKAIPIDWIKCWIDKFFKDINGTRYYMGDGYDTVWDMLEDWEKENENIKESD